MNRSDEQLVADYLGGEEKSLEILFSRYLKPVYGFVCRYAGGQEAEDITQEVFVKAWRNLKKFDREKKFKTWIFAIAKNTAIDFLRKKKTIPFSEFENEDGENAFADNLADASPAALEVLGKNSMVQAINLIIKSLSPQHRLVLSLYYGNNLNFREISEKLGEPLHTVKSRHRRALIKLKEFFAGQG